MGRGSERENLFRKPSSAHQTPPTFLQLHFDWVWPDLQLCCSSHQLILTDRVPQEHWGPEQTSVRSEDDNRQSPCPGFGPLRLRPLWACKCVILPWPPRPLPLQPPLTPLPLPRLPLPLPLPPADLAGGQQPARWAALPARTPSSCHRSVGLLGVGVAADWEDSSQQSGNSPPCETAITALGHRASHLWWPGEF